VSQKEGIHDLLRLIASMMRNDGINVKEGMKQAEA
jgi:hypothetical protein